MLLANHRIEIDARPAPPAPPVLEVAMIGHCPSAPERGLEALFCDGQLHLVRDVMAVAGRVHWDRLARDELLLSEIAGLGFARETTRLRTLAAALDAGTPIELQPQDPALMGLYGLPIPLHTFGQFQSLFPEAFDTPTHYRSVLGGERAWLPLAVQDFFEHSGSDTRLKLWIIRVDEAAGSRAFLPAPDAHMIAPETLGAFERALLIPRVAILALPDLERLQIPAHLPDIPRLRLGNPVPVFLPCGTEVDDGHRERRDESEIPPMPAPLTALEIVAPIGRALARWRPDIQCLLTVAIDAVPGSERPGASQEFLTTVTDLESGKLSGGSRGPAAEALRHLQLLYPYLRGPDRRLGSPAGLVAGMQAVVSQTQGPWRSAAGRPLPGRSLPWPPLSQHEATSLRDQPGVTVLMHRAGRTVIDDERLCAPLLPGVAVHGLPARRHRDEAWRSAEIMRFMNWLRRELQALGERMIFDVDPRDPRPRLALRAFFTGLYTLGALRGATADESFALIQRDEGESTLAFDIEIAPAYPIDRLRITFMQDRHSASASTRIEMDHG